MSASPSAVKSAAQPTSRPDRHWYFREAPELPEKWRSPIAQDQLLYEYLIHYGHIALFATSRGLTIDQFYDWLHSEPVLERRRRLEEMAQDRADTVAKLNRPAALERLAEIANNIQDIHPRERRLAAGAILRHAQAADRREVEKLKAAPAQAARPSPHHPITSSPTQFPSPSHRLTESPSHSPPSLARIGLPAPHLRLPPLNAANPRPPARLPAHSS